MPAQLKLYRFVEDAWNDGLRAWCEAASRAALDGFQCWLVIAGRGQMRWIKRRALREDMTLFGIKFLDAAMLRRELCALLGVETLSPGRDTLEFLLKVTALRRNDADSQSVAQNARACLGAMEELSAAGWSEKELDVAAPAARAFFQTLKNSRAWPPELDRELLKRAMTQPLWSCVTGWDAAHFGDLNLLEALTRSSGRCDLFLPMPRSAAETVQQQWIEAIETRLNTSKTMCNASGFESPHEPLVARLEGTDLEARVAQKPRLLIGRDWRDEIRLVRDDVIGWLACAPVDARIALIVPRRSPTSVALVRALAEAGIELLDETGEKIEPALDVLIQSQIVRYHLLGCDLEPLVELIKLLNEKAAGSWLWLDPARVHGLLDNAFAKLQTRNARLLACGFENERDELWPRILEFIERLGKWEGEFSWSQACAKWEAALAPFSLTTELFHPLWSSVGELLGATKINGQTFLEYLDAVLSARNSQRPPEAAAPHARVIVTTAANAAQQTWERLVFLDSNEGVWPLKTEENPFLDDLARAKLNARRGHLLTTGEHSALEQARFLDLLEHCTGEVVFAATARESGEAAREAYPNEWLIRCLVESHGSDAKTALGEWSRAIEVCARAAVALPADEREHLEIVHASRCDPAIPFDQYLFNFRKSSFVAQSWSAAKLDEATTCPATFALREIFGAEALREMAWTRGEGVVIGSQAHVWLARALDGGEDFKPLRCGDVFTKLNAQVAATRQCLQECYATEKLPLPIWWETCLRKAAWVARRCLAAITQIEGDWFYAMEKRERLAIKTDDGSLRLKGRFDLVLSDRASFDGARMIVIDFKTGKAAPPSFTTLANGYGFQFAAYYLMAKDAGAASVSVGVIRHDLTKLDSFTDSDEPALRTAIIPLAKLQRDLNFGRRGALVAEWGNCETLPIATLALDAQVLAQKAELSLA